MAWRKSGLLNNITLKRDSVAQTKTSAVLFAYHKIYVWGDKRGEGNRMLGKPVIGITVAHCTEELKTFPRHYYVESIRKAGGIPIVLPTIRT